jgi:beta-phosphoglucomutase-like phosphatase (HAD superfamily)
MQVAAIVLDMDGLMLDTEPLYKASWQEAAGEVGYDLDDRTYQGLIGRRTEECEDELLKHFGPGFPMARFRARWPALWRLRADTVGIVLKPGLLDFLDFVESRGLPMAVATSTERRDAEFSLRRAELLRRFQVVVTGDQIAHGKPAPDIYLEAARRLGVEPFQCVVCEDSDAGIVAASRAGMVPLLIPDLKPPSPEALEAAYRVLESLDDARHLLETLLSWRATSRSPPGDGNQR